MLNFKNGMKITSNVNDDLSGIFGSHILLILMVSRIKDKMQSLMKGNEIVTCNTTLYKVCVLLLNVKSKMATTTEQSLT
jgi:hypothetical protein